MWPLCLRVLILASIRLERGQCKHLMTEFVVVHKSHFKNIEVLTLDIITFDLVLTTSDMF